MAKEHPRWNTMIFALPPYQTCHKTWRGSQLAMVEKRDPLRACWPEIQCLSWCRCLIHQSLGWLMMSISKVWRSKWSGWEGFGAMGIHIFHTQLASWSYWELPKDSLAKFCCMSTFSCHLWREHLQQGLDWWPYRLDCRIQLSTTAAHDTLSEN